MLFTHFNVFCVLILSEMQSQNLTNEADNLVEDLRKGMEAWELGHVASI